MPPAVQVKVTSLPPGQDVDRIVLLDPLGNEIDAADLTAPPAPKVVKPGSSVLDRRNRGEALRLGSGSFRAATGGLSYSLAGGFARGGTASATLPVPDADSYFRESNEYSVVIYARDDEGHLYTYQTPAPEYPGDLKVSQVEGVGGPAGATGRGF